VQKKCESTQQSLRDAQEEIQQLRSGLITIDQSVQRFKEELEEVISLYEDRMNSLNQKEKNMMQKKTKEIGGGGGAGGGEGDEEKNNRVLITSKLWGSVIAITSGIETSVNATDDVTDFDTISEKDYRTKNTFEIYNP
jgi:hypothetical protein